MIPDFQIHRNLFGTWHVDSGAEKSAPYLHRKDYKFVKCGIYLQDNSKEWGGGIQLVPKSHLFPIKTQIRKLDHKIKSIRDKFSLKNNILDVPIKAGDFLAFDSRLLHK